MSRKYVPSKQAQQLVDEVMHKFDRKELDLESLMRNLQRIKEEDVKLHLLDPKPNILRKGRWYLE